MSHQCYSFRVWSRMLENDAVLKGVSLLKNPHSADLLADCYSQGIEPNMQAVEEWSCGGFRSAA